MNIRRKLHNNKKGYTLLELMITLFIFAIITMFGLPAFYNFIEQSRAKTQIIQAANFLRSAQEIATSTNRTVYVYTEGYFDYASHENDYWYQKWIMSFKPIGRDFTSITDQDAALYNSSDKSPNPNYLIATQTIFTDSKLYQLNVLDSLDHNAIDLKKIVNSTVDIEMDGYSKVRDAASQGSTTGKPTYLVFYPSGAVVMPVFIMSEIPKNPNNTPIDTSFSSTKSWATLKGGFIKPIGILAGCRMGRGLSIDSINYTFSNQVMDTSYLFESIQRNSIDPNHLDVLLYSAPSFGKYLCGSKFLQ